MEDFDVRYQKVPVAIKTLQNTTMDGIISILPFQYSVEMSHLLFVGSHFD